MWSLRPDIKKEDEEKLAGLAINLKNVEVREGTVVELPDAGETGELLVPEKCKSDKGGLLGGSLEYDIKKQPDDGAWCTKYLYLAALATLLGFALWGAAFDRNPTHHEHRATPVPAPAPAPQHQGDAPEFLPAYTWDTILEHDTSPQARAFAWVQDHPQFEQMPIWRIQQLLALATIGFASRGDMPIIKVDTNECSWSNRQLQVDCNYEGKMTKLQVLKGSNQEWKVPAEISLLTALNKLEIRDGGEFLVGTLPSQIGELTALTYLSIFQNQLTGTLPSQVGQLTELRNLVVSNTQIGGSLPHQLGQLRALQELHLAFNELEGLLPDWIVQLTDLSILKLGRNKLGGLLPKQLGLMTNLKELSLESNDFFGSIPRELSSLSHLSVLQLFENQLTSSIPTELAQMTSLDALFLHENKLTGPIPSSSVGQLRMLEALKLHDNSLTGSIDSGVCDLIRLTVVSVDCDQVTCTCSQCTCGE